MPDPFPINLRPSSKTPDAFKANIQLNQDLKQALGIENCPVIKSAGDIAAAFETLSKLEREVMIGGTVDCKCRLVFWNLISVGASDRVSLRVGEVFCGAIRTQASAVFLVHNHPSGSLEPSSADLQTTEDVARAGLLLGYPLLDHLIISRLGYKSLLTSDSLTGQKGRKRSTLPVVHCAESSSTTPKWTCAYCRFANARLTELGAPQKVGDLCSLAECSNCKKQVWLRQYED
ncbi:MAG TPA: JAB domain-containing protein [Planctomycetota bacterium]|nr:JAB domain-containing protein [Planctomycetota bacterium]